MSPAPTGHIDSCKVVQVIQIDFLRGTGVDEDPLRTVTQWRTLEGDLIQEKDPFPET